MIRKLNFSKKMFLNFLTIFIFTIVTISYAQTDEKIQFADSLSTMIQKKLLLNDVQKLSVKNILLDYLQDKSSNAKKQSAANEKIANLLDKKQKAKFVIIKDEWWGKLNQFLMKK